MRQPKLIKEAFLFLILILTAYVPSRGSDFRGRADIFMENLVKENFAAVVSSFTPWLAERHQAAELEEIWYKTVALYGPYQKHNFGETIESDTTLSYLYVIEFERATFVMVAAFDSQGEVMTFIMQPPERKPIISQPFWIVPDYLAAETPIFQIPPYVDTSLFNEVDFVMQGSPPLPATMTLAKTDEPNRVVLLFHGFGPNDRDETVGSLKPLRDIAWGLASQGIASIRFDCRSYTQPPDVVAGYNLDQYVLDDLAAMLAYIRMESVIFDTTRIFIAGHGLGGMVAPLAAMRDGGLAGMILLSTPARPFGEMLLETVQNDLAVADSIDNIGREQLDEVAGILNRLKNRDLPPDEMVISAPARVWYDLMDNDQVEISQKLALPILVIHSGRDFRTAAIDYEIWKSRLAGHHNATLKKYDNLNHFYQPGLGPADKTDYISNTAPVDRQLIDDLAVWIKSK